MPIDNNSVQCGGCGVTLEEDPSLPVESRGPCPVCGSATRLFQVAIRVKAAARSKLGLRGKHAGSVEPFFEQVSGDDLHHKTGKWMKHSRVIGRDNDLYHEVVTNPETGEVVHECKEKLSQHRGHGAANLKKNGR